MGGVTRGIARVLALEAVAVAPTAAVLYVDLHLAEVIALAGLCLAFGYLLIRVPDSRPIDEGAWLGVAIGGGIGLAQAEAAVLAAIDDLAWVRPWLLSIVACAGIGLALGFVARYDQHQRALRMARAVAAAPHPVARLK